MTHPFWKMHGAGNDFILFDDRAHLIPADQPVWLAGIAARRTGIGAEGILLLQTSSTADFRMIFFNPDGHPAEMCGNGARCAARLAFELELAPSPMTIETDAGILHASVDGDTVELTLPAPTNLAPYCDIEVDGRSLCAGTANTGVPHVIVEVQNLKEAPVEDLGARIRHHLQFAPHGTNVNFVHTLDPSHLEVRTYERGVEGETGACGTGAAAAAIVMALRGRATPPITVTTSSHDRLRVNFRISDDAIHDLTLAGPAVHVYSGSIELPTA